GVATVLLRQASRCGAGTALKFIADHARAAADVAFRDGSGLRLLQGLQDMLLLDVKAIAIVEVAIPGLRYHRHRPGLKELVVLDLPSNDFISDHADTVRIGNHDRTFQEARLVHPGGPGHFAIAVER